MRTSLKSILIVVPTVFLVLLSVPLKGQATDDSAVPTKAIAPTFDANARQLTVFDRSGKVLSLVGERAIYNQPVFSPDRKQLAVRKIDLNQSTDIWVLNIGTGNAT